MSITPGYSNEEIKELIAEYEAVPYGSRGAWLVDKPFTEHQFRRWREFYFEGDLERGLVPVKRESRAQALVKAKAAEEELERVKSETEAEIAAMKQAHQEALAERDAQIKLLEAGHVALGKAIGLLQNLNFQEPEN